MASSSDPANVAYVIQENGFWYVAYKEKVKVPNVIVSAKGVANGLSEEYNDGWDFGPDSYNPSVTSGVPLTQTSGIQEAINYVTTQGVGKIMLKGQFDISNAPLIEDPNNPGQYCQLYLPYVELNNVNSGGLSIGIDSVGTSNIPFYISQAIKTPLNATYILSNYSGTENMTVFYQMHGPSDVRGGQSEISLSIGSLIVFSYPKSNINGIDLSATIHVSAENLVAVTSNMLSYTGLPTEYGGTGINLQLTGYGGTKIFGHIVVGGYNIGLIPNVHTSIQKYSTYFISTGIQINSDVLNTNSNYLAYIGYYDLQTTGIAINIITGKIGISAMSYGDVETTSGYFFTYQYHIQVLAGNTGSAYINYMVVNVTGVSTTNVLGTPTVVPALNIQGAFGGKINYSNPPLPASLPANPPVSATVYQNTNPFDIEIDLPVYATTAGTAGYVTLAKGTTSTPASMGNQYVNGATSSTSVDIIRLRVPAGWYYSFTASGVTLGTATVFAD